MTLEQRKIAFIGGGHITNIVIDNLTRTQTVNLQAVPPFPNKPLSAPY